MTRPALLLCLLALPTFAVAGEGIPADVKAALSEDATVAEAAIDRLREQGREAFEKLVDLDAEALGVDAARLDGVIDRVGGARYCSVSKLYWHTDLDEALAEANATGKPVLALRMMGYLTDEYSCANSRFFRTTLYANEEIGKFLRENYVLHWRSVRPVPKVTVDFGDGRKLERTLTGNSIHYVLGADGTVIDGLPGLYGPTRFLGWLQSMHGYATSYNGLVPEARIAYRESLKTGFHQREVSRILRAWKTDLDRIAATDEAADEDDPEAAKRRAILAALAAVNSGGAQPAAAPPARAAAIIARPKAIVELPLIADVTGETDRLTERTDETMWERLAELHAGDAQLDAATRALIARENPALAANVIAPTKRKVENPLLRMLVKLEASIALDTVRNEYELHRRLHQWFVDGNAPTEIEELNEKVYAELFLTPSSDPWIGLVPADVYTGLENGGVVVDTAN